LLLDFEFGVPAHASLDRTPVSLGPASSLRCAGYALGAVVDLRNLDQIQEQDDSASNLRLGSWLLGAAGIGALILTAVMSMPEKHVALESTEDPLAALIAKAKEEKAQPADQLSPEHASFAQILTDKERAAAALVAVKASDGHLIETADKAGVSALPAPPPPADQLPVVPLPAGKLLDSTKLTNDPQDALTGLAADRAQMPRGGDRAEEGAPGDYQLQVASYNTKAEADSFVEALRLRGHRAHIETTRIPNRGLWYRVRIGPFKDKAKAVAYKAEFERKEGMSPYVIDPEVMERREAQRAAKLAQIKIHP
jgi:DedD protein